ncbi:tyrosine-type recombinase/integrase [Amycolatopsis sp. lyj-23]|uniref:tyrosine-type recombinase/integrase n=1 Tax=Amycolatopsis sp. lyj-23 TaxID=2789283 RepID=UPI00397951D0
MREDHQVQRHGYDTSTAATKALEHVRELLDVAGHDDRTRVRIADMIVERTKHRGTLPSVEEARRKFGAGIDPTAPTMSLDELIDDWLKSKRKLKPRSKDDYRAGLRVFSAHLGSMSVDRITDEHIADVLDFYDARNVEIEEAREAGLPVPIDELDPRTSPKIVSTNTQGYYFGLLRMCLDHGRKRRRLIAYNPCNGIELPERTRFDATVWGRDEVIEFLGRTAADRLHCLYRLALLAGLRRGEVCGLRWSDFADDYRTVTIARSVRYVSRTDVIAGGTKNEASAAEVSIDETTAGLLKKLHRQQRRERLAAGVAWRGAPDPADDWVFTALDGFPVRPSGVADTFKRRAAELGLSVIRFHDARHTHATLMWEAGIDSKLVSARLRHKSERTTREIYTHVRRAVRDDVATQVVNFVFNENAV